MKLEAGIAATCDGRYADWRVAAVLQAITLVLIALLSCIVCPTAWAADDEQAQTAMRDQYRDALQSLNQLQVHNKYLQQLIDNQQVAMSTADRQLENYRKTKPEIVPLMTRMIESLGQFVELDLPFLIEERRQRVQNLRLMMNRPDVPLAEKLARILDAYRIEMEFGREVEFADGWLDANGAGRDVAFLRVGRIVLAYQTRDRAETGFFNPATRQWELLPDKYRNVVAEGLRIASKQSAPILLTLPVAAPGTAK